MHKHSIGIVGASGYSGMEAVRLLSKHPHVELSFVTSDRWMGERVSRRQPVTGAAAALTYVGQDQAEALGASCEVVLLATPAEASLQLAPRLLAKGVKVVDLSGAFRLQAQAAYPKWYGFTHHAPELLATAAYGMTELYRGRVKEASLVANPGCYPTAATLPLAPLLSEKLVEPSSLIINAASGVSGAGRKASEDYSFCEVDGDFRAYKVLKHQHTPEISQTLGLIAGADVPVTFTPHLLPIKRGILCTTYAFLTRGASPQKVKDALAAAYGDEPFISLAATAEEVALKNVVGTNVCQIGFAVDGARLVLISAIDNLVKGAAGQAVQNMNLLLGFDDAEGLS